MTARWLPLTVGVVVCSIVANFGTFLLGNLGRLDHVFLGAIVASAIVALLMQTTKETATAEFPVVLLGGMITAVASHFALTGVNLLGNIPLTLAGWIIVGAVVAAIFDIALSLIGVESANA